MANTARKQEIPVTNSPKGNSQVLGSVAEFESKALIIDLAEACELLGVAKVTMYGYLKRGVVPAFKYPGSRVWKFDRGQLEQWLKAQQQGGGQK